MQPSIPTLPNHISTYATPAKSSTTASVDQQLWDDIAIVLQGHCIYLPQMVCSANDFSLVTSLVEDLNVVRVGIVNWSEHFKCDQPDVSPTFRHIIQVLSAYFDLDVHASRLNFYADETDWKPFHHDSHAPGTGKEEFTAGASFGAPRELSFLHPPSGHTFNFPQNNGDVFAFTSLANQKFQHGIPKSRVPTGPRFSVIVWGKRRILTERNSGSGERNTVPKSLAYEKPDNSGSTKESKEHQKPPVQIEKVLTMVKSWVREENQVSGGLTATKDNKSYVVSVTCPGFYIPTTPPQGHIFVTFSDGRTKETMGTEAFFLETQYSYRFLTKQEYNEKLAELKTRPLVPKPTTSSWALSQDLEMQVVSYLNLADMYFFSLSSKQTRACVRAYFHSYTGMRARVWSWVSQVFSAELVQELLPFQNATGAALTGSAVLKVFSGDSWEAKDLDFLLPFNKTSMRAFQTLLKKFTTRDPNVRIVAHDSLGMWSQQRPNEPSKSIQFSHWEELDNNNRVEDWRYLKDSLAEFAKNAADRSDYQKHVRGIYYTVTFPWNEVTGKLEPNLDFVFIPEVDVNSARGLTNWMKLNFDISVCCNIVYPKTCVTLAPHEIATRKAFLRNDQYCMDLRMHPQSSLTNPYPYRWPPVKGKFSPCECGLIILRRYYKYQERGYDIQIGSYVQHQGRSKIFDLTIEKSRYQQRMDGPQNKRRRF